MTKERFLSGMKSPKLFLVWILRKFLAPYVSDVHFLKWIYRLRMGEKLDLENPKSYNAKCQWLKLYYRKPELITMADKILAKKWVADQIGSEYVIPLLGAWNSFDEIDFSKLPDKFVLKCNHDSGSVVLVRDKNTMDKTAARKKLMHALNTNAFWYAREWPYKNIERKIIAEPLIESLGRRDSIEYKVSCMNDEVKFVTVCQGIAHAGFDDRTNDHFTKEWKRLDWYVRYKPSGKFNEKPSYMDKIIELSEKLAKGLPHVRVDWYYEDGQLYFGELTFYTWSGFCPFVPKEWNDKLGSWIKLPEKYNEV